MNTHADKTQGNKSQSVVNQFSQKQNGDNSSFQFEDNRPESIAQRKLQEMVNSSPKTLKSIQCQAEANNHFASQSIFSQVAINKSLPQSAFAKGKLAIQRIVIPAISDKEENIDTSKINFRNFIHALAVEGNSRRLMYIIKYISANASNEEAALLLGTISEEIGSLMPREEVERIGSKVEIFKKSLTSKEFKLLANLLQRDTASRTQELLNIVDPTKIKTLIDKWVGEEKEIKSAPVKGDWRNTIQLAQPLIDLINSILKHGILSPEEAQKRGLSPVSSVDKGVSDKISLNTFANQSQNLTNARRIALQSMSLEQRGSISVSTERRDDTILSRIPPWEEIVLSPEEILEINQKAKGMESFRPMLINHYKQEKALRAYKQALSGPLRNVINTRAQGTIMAILDKSTTGKSSTNVDENTGEPTEDSSQEVRMTRPQIRTGHIHVLLVPDFIRPYFDLIVNPADIPIHFVSTIEVSAYYKTGLGDLKLEEVVAPDYVEDIAQKLVENGVVSTHIVTTNANRYAVPPDFDEEEATRQLEEFEAEGFFDSV